MSTPTNLNECRDIKQLFGYVQNLSAKDIGLLGGRKFATKDGKDVSFKDIVGRFEAIYGTMDKKNDVNLATAKAIVDRLHILDEDADAKLDAAGRVKKALTLITSRISGGKERFSLLERSIRQESSQFAKAEREEEIVRLDALHSTMPVYQLLNQYAHLRYEDEKASALKMITAKIGNETVDLKEISKQVLNPQQFLLFIDILASWKGNHIREKYSLLDSLTWPQGLNKNEEIPKALAKVIVDSWMFSALVPTNVGLLLGKFQAQQLDINPRSLFSEPKSVRTSQPIPDAVGKAVALAIKQKCEKYESEQKKRGIQNPVGIQVRLMQSSDYRFTFNEIYSFIKAMADVSPIPTLVHIDLQDISGDLEPAHIRELERLIANNPSIKQLNASSNYFRSK